MKTITDSASIVGKVAYKFSQVIPIYPITPSSPMAEMCASLSEKKEKNLFGQDVKIVELQSEGGVAGTLHGALLSKAFSSTFTSSQGLLLMMPNMFKIAGESLPAVIHVASRAVASQALSIFCDHSDVMAVRSTGFLMLSSHSVQESYDMSVISHILAMKSLLPVLHFFDGFRTSHEIQKIDILKESQLKTLAKDYFEKFASSYKDVQYGTAQNPDVFFQNRERNEQKYQNVKSSLKEIFNEFENLTGRKYNFFEFYGQSNAKNIIVAMGSSCKSIEEYIDKNPDKKIGLIKVRLFRPFFEDEFISSLPKEVKTITVIDRTKENGGENPLFQDVVCSVNKYGINAKVLSGRYGLGGKDFDLNQIHTIFENMNGENKTNFTVGIDDDISNSSLKIIPFQNDNDDNFEIKIFGLGSDGSVSSSKGCIKILGEKYNKFVQGYFEYDSKKSGSLTISHLRLSDNPIKSEYLLKNENIVCINNFSFVTKYDCLSGLKNNGVVLINSIFKSDEIDKVLPVGYVNKLKETNSKLFVINAQKIAKENGLGQKVNIIMQSALLLASGLLNKDEIKNYVGNQVEKSFASKGQIVIEKNLNAVNDAI